jgi:hypothetical protein
MLIITAGEEESDMVISQNEFDSSAFNVQNYHMELFKRTKSIIPDQSKNIKYI